MSWTTDLSQEDKIKELQSCEIKMIWFDLDGTLYSSNENINRIIQEYIYTKAANLLNVSIEEARQLWLEKYKEKWSWWKALVAMWVNYWPDLVQEAFENTDFTQYLVPNEEILKTLLQLKEKWYIIDIITWSNFALASQKLKHLNIPTSIFNHIIWNDECTKSDWTSFRKWLWKYEDFSTDNFVYIGDKEATDIEQPQLLWITGILLDPKWKSSNNCIKIKLITDLNQIFLW